MVSGGSAAAQCGSPLCCLQLGGHHWEGLATGGSWKHLKGFMALSLLPMKLAKDL